MYVKMLHFIIITIVPCSPHVTKLNPISFEKTHRVQKNLEIFGAYFTFFGLDAAAAGTATATGSCKKNIVICQIIMFSLFWA